MLTKVSTVMEVEITEAGESTPKVFSVPTAGQSEHLRGPKCIGVYLEPDGLLLVQSCGQTVMGSKRMPLDPAVLHDGPRLSASLASALRDFAPPGGRYDLWATAVFPSLTIGQVRIPKMSGPGVSNAIYWTAKKEFSLDGPETVLWDFTIDGDINENGLQKTCATVYSVGTDEVRFIENAFLDAGYPLTGITIPFFAYQNLFKSGLVQPDDESAVFLHMGDEASQITIVSGSRVVISRGIKTGAHSLIDAISRSPGGLISEQELVSRLPGAPGKPKDPDAPIHSSPAPDANRNETYDLLQPAVHRLVRQIQRTMHADVVTRSDINLRGLYVSGALCSSEALLEHLSQGTGLEYYVLEPEINGDQGDEMVQNETRNPNYLPALGLSLSDAAVTPNLLNTFAEKNKNERTTRFTHAFLLGFIGIMVLLAGFQILLDKKLSAKRIQLAELQAQVEDDKAQINESILTVAVDNAQQMQSKARLALVRGYPLVVIRELISIRADSVFLTRVDVTMDALHDQGGKGNRPNFYGGHTAHTLILKGNAVGEATQLEALLADYIAKLEETPTFHHVKLMSKDRHMDQVPAALSFTLIAAFDPPSLIEPEAEVKGDPGV